MVYLPTNSPEKSTTWSHVAKHKIHRSYGNVKKNLQLYCPFFRLFHPIHPNIGFFQRQKTIYYIRTVRPHVEPRNRYKWGEMGPQQRLISSKKCPWIFGRLWITHNSISINKKQLYKKTQKKLSDNTKKQNPSTQTFTLKHPETPPKHPAITKKPTSARQSTETIRGGLRQRRFDWINLKKVFVLLLRGYFETT